MTRYEAYIGKDWKKLGMANVLVARIRPEKGVEFAVFLVDIFCLGVKDAMHEEGLSDGEFRRYLNEHVGEHIREPIHPACAKKLIEGAIAYAENLGFSPHRDYRKARKVLSGLDAASCPETFLYGEDGMPCYVRGPDDSEDRVDRVLTVLERKCGPDGFKFVDPNEEEDDMEYEARNDLIAWLEEESEDVPRFFEVSGIITAMQLCPESLSPSALVNVIWDPAGPPGLADLDEAREFLDLLKNYWNEVARMIYTTVAVDAAPDETCIDVWESDFEPDDAPSLIFAMSEWARGFMRATEIWPEPWAEPLNRADLAPHWEVLRCMSDLGAPGIVEKIEQMAAERPPRNLGRAVATIARALREPFEIPYN
jgi:yecA family protein